MALRGPAGLLHDIIVDPGYRRRGVGRTSVGFRPTMIEMTRELEAGRANDDAAR